MLKVSSILMAICIFLTCIFTCAVPVYASSLSVDFAATLVLDFFTDLLSSYQDNITRKQEAARAYFFTYLTSNKYGYSGDIFTSDNKFDDKYLEYAFDKYLQNAYYLSSFPDTDGDIFLSAAGFPNVHFSVSLCNFYSSHSEQLTIYGFNHDDCPSNFNSFKDYYQSFLARYILSQGGEASDPNPGKTGLQIAPGYVTSEEFKEELNRLNELYTPKGNDLFLNSYRTDTYYHTDVIGYSDSCQYWSSSNTGQTADYIYPVTLYQNPSEREGLTDLWCLPFYKSEAGEMYYNNYLLHLYYMSVDDENVDTALMLDVYSFNRTLGWIKEDTLCGRAYEFTQSLGQQKPYQVRLFLDSYSEADGFTVNRSYLSIVKTFEDYSGFIANQGIINENFRKLEKLYYSSDRTKSLGLIDKHNFEYSSSDDRIVVPIDFYNFKIINNDVTGHNHDPNYTSNPNKNNDYGFICSESMINLNWDFDTSKIQDGQIVEVNGGDTIYNYNITNPSTGQRSTVNEYITNNYTYVEQSGGEQGSGGTGGTGGSVSGNVDVSGEVGVHGDINVDVNINQGGTGVNPNDFITGDVDLGGYYDDAVSMATGVNGIMQKFFDFLPPEILTLLGILIAVAIVCRLLGR